VTELAEMERVEHTETVVDPVFGGTFVRVSGPEAIRRIRAFQREQAEKRRRERSAARRRQRERDRRRACRREETRVKCRGLTWRLLHAAREARTALRRLELAQGEALHGLRSEDRYRDLGHVRFADFCREALQLHPRTARRRIAVHDILREVPEAGFALRDGRVDASKLLALRPVLNPGNAPLWLGVAANVSVRSLAERVGEARAEAAGSPAPGAAEDAGPRDLEEPGRVRVAFPAPQSVGFAFEHAMETARCVLGWDAPRDECLDAMLSEAESSHPWLAAPPGGTGGDGTAGPESVDPGAEGRTTPRAGNGEHDAMSPAWAPAGRLPWADRVGGDRSRSGRRRTVAVRTDGGREPSRPWSPSYHRWDYKRAKNCLRALERRLRRLRRLTRRIGEAGEARAADPEADRARSVIPARALLDRYRALEKEVRPLLVLQARALVHLQTMDAPVLIGLPHLGELGVRLLGLSERTTWDRFRVGFAFQYDRALTEGYLRGGIGLGHVLALAGGSDVDTAAMAERARALTYRQFRRELRFLSRLRLVGLGWNTSPPRLITDPAVEARLRRRLARAGWSMNAVDRYLNAQGVALPEGSSRDPAENPVRMAQLEELLDLAILASCRDPGESEEFLRDRKTLSTPGRHHRVVVWARPAILDRWERACRAVRSRSERFPPWVAAFVVSKTALEQWVLTDPGRIPTERRILERDGWRCRAPGCSSRRSLEVHHIRFRSRGGSNASWNLVTLCHAHHHHALHRGTLRVTGRAPHALVWEIGCSPDASPLWTYRGDRLALRDQTGMAVSSVPAVQWPADPAPSASARARSGSPRSR